MAAPTRASIWQAIPPTAAPAAASAICPAPPPPASTASAAETYEDIPAGLVLVGLDLEVARVVADVANPDRYAFHPSDDPDDYPPEIREAMFGYKPSVGCPLDYLADPGSAAD